jgi:hypothetical protein
LNEAARGLAARDVLYAEVGSASEHGGLVIGSADVATRESEPLGARMGDTPVARPAPRTTAATVARSM